MNWRRMRVLGDGECGGAGSYVEWVWGCGGGGFGGGERAGGADEWVGEF